MPVCNLSQVMTQVKRDFVVLRPPKTACHRVPDDILKYQIDRILKNVFFFGWARRLWHIV